VRGLSRVRLGFNSMSMWFRANIQGAAICAGHA
jgi:hypothetical protein